jgi:hypothetical protein
MRIRSEPFVEAVTIFAPVADRARVPAFVTSGVVKDVEAISVVKAPVDGVVAPMVVLFIVPPVRVTLDDTIPEEIVPSYVTVLVVSSTVRSEPH